jgi:hypothetical protein
MADSQAAPTPKPTKITQVSYGMTVNTGNYETVRFDLTAQVAPDEDWRDVLDSLRRKSRKLKERIQSDGD